MAFNLLNTGCSSTPGTFGELWSILDANTDQFWINTYIPGNGTISFDKFGGGTDSFNFPYFEDKIISGINYVWPTLGDYCTITTTNGTFQYDAQLISYTGQTIAVAQNLSAFDRIDIIAINPAGTLIVIGGTPAAVPAAPPLGTNLLYGYMLVPALSNCASTNIVFTFLGYNSNGLGAGLNPGDVLTWNGGIWVSQAPVFSFPAQAINWLTDVNTTAPSVGQALTWNGANWVNTSIGTIPIGTVTHSTLRWSGAAWVESTLFKNTNEAEVWFGNSGTSGYPTGSGTRFMFIADKQAVRCGNITGALWDASNIGLGSVAIGVNASSIATYSAVFGQSNFANGTAHHNLIFGNINTSISQYSFVGGNNNYNGGTYNTFIFGQNNTINAGTPTNLNHNNVFFGNNINVSTTFPSRNFIVSTDSNSGAGQLQLTGITTSNCFVFQDNTRSNIINGNGNALAFGRDVSIYGSSNLVKTLFCDNVIISAYAQRLNMLACRNMLISSWNASKENNVLVGLDNVMTTGFAYDLNDTVHVSRLKLFGAIVYPITIHTNGVISPGVANSPFSTADKSVIIASPGTSVTLPSNPPPGQSVKIKRNASAGANITVSGSHPIDGSATLILSTPWASVELVFTGTIWAIF